MLCLISASFTGCISDDSDDTTATDTTDSTDNSDNADNTSETDGNNATNDSGGGDWTFMTYISDSDLEYFSIEDMVEMERVGSTDKVNIVCLLYTSPSPRDRG